MKKLVRVCACLVVLVAAALAGAQTAAYGQKVVVSPADLKGWVQTSRSGYVAPPNGGTYLVYSGFLEEGQALSTGGAEQQVPPGNPKGPGAFFLFTNIGINTPGMVTLGNDLLNGVPLKNITTLKYTTYTFADGNNPAQHCMSPDYKWGLVSHPISLDLYAEKSGGYSNFRQLMHRPWQNVPAKDCFGGISTRFGAWETHDALEQGQWIVPATQAGPYTWAQLKSYLPNAVLRTPPIADWASGSPSGCSLDLRGGVPVSGQREGGCFTPDSHFGSWWTETANLWGLVDNLIVGWNDTAGVAHEVTFDFESKIAYVTGNTDAHDSSAGLASSVNETLFVLAGRVLATDRTDNTFVIDDGSGKLVTVVSEYHGLGTRDVVVKVRGALNQSTEPYPTLTCTGAAALEILDETFPL